MAMDQKYLFYESQSANSEEQESLLEGNATWLWNDRLFLIKHSDDDENESDDEHNADSEHKKSDSEFWRFTALDLITNETRPVCFSKSNSEFRQVKVVSLNKDYGFVVESGDDSFRVNLVKLNWAPGEFQMIEQFDHPDHFYDILVDNLSPTKFGLVYYNMQSFIFQAYKLDSGKIEFVGNYGSDFFEYYFNDKLFFFESDQITTYNLTTTEEKSVQIEDIDDGELDLYRMGWVKDRLYSAVCFDDDENFAKKYGIAYTELETKRWTSIDFVTDMQINKMQYFNGNLVVYANNYDGYYESVFDAIYCRKFKVYSIPVRHPQSLRKTAWPLVVQQFKRNEKITDPYQAASKFLPFNCDLRPPWYKEETALENLKEPKSSVNSVKEMDEGDAIEKVNGKNNGDASTLGQESSEDVSPKRAKFD